MAQFYLLAALTPNALILTCQLFWSAAQRRPPLPINRFRNSLLLRAAKRCGPTGVQRESLGCRLFLWCVRGCGGLRQRACTAAVDATRMEPFPCQCRLVARPAAAIPARPDQSRSW
jgi:hypothetical protein